MIYAIRYCIHKLLLPSTCTFYIISASIYYDVLYTHAVVWLMQLIYCLPYSGLFSRGKIFMNFPNQTIRENFTLEMLTFNRYSLQSVRIRENFPLEKLGIAQFVKIFPLENNPLYGTYLYRSDPNAQYSVDVDYINYILTYQDTRLTPQCCTFHLVICIYVRCLAHCCVLVFISLMRAHHS